MHTCLVRTKGFTSVKTFIGWLCKELWWGKNWTKLNPPDTTHVLGEVGGRKVDTTWNQNTTTVPHLQAASTASAAKLTPAIHSFMITG